MANMQSYMKQRNTGFTLTEIAIVLAIVGIILGAIWVAAKSVLDASRTNQAIQDISTMATNMRSVFAAQTQFTISDDQTSAMISAGVVPNNLLVSGGTSAKNSWGYPVRIYLSRPDARHFRISYYGTSFDVCFRIASNLANIGTSDAPTALTTFSGGYNIPIPNSGGTVGLTSAQIQTACNNNSASGNGNDSTEFDYTIH